jgi:alkanesulfonate monooxygenase SsuD/methylene tetrahydromethanopterin reductase-like flavin-dependent oxidoreductase (luciferase family)
MTEFGYTAMCEQTPVRQLVSDVVAAEQAGFDFSVMSDHYFPWIEEQGHSGYAWSVLGAAAQATSQMPLMTFVTCPSFRYHPAVVAQMAATMGILSGGLFTLGLGAGERGAARFRPARQGVRRGGASAGRRLRARQAAQDAHMILNLHTFPSRRHAACCASGRLVRRLPAGQGSDDDERGSRISALLCRGVLWFLRPGGRPREALCSGPAIRGRVC